MDLGTTNPTVVLNMWHTKLGGQANRRYAISVILIQTSVLQSDLSNLGLKPLNPSLLLTNLVSSVVVTMGGGTTTVGDGMVS